MIDKQHGTFLLICDICGEEADEILYNFDEAVAYKKFNGWKSERRGGQWQDVCPECQEAG